MKSDIWAATVQASLGEPISAPVRSPLLDAKVMIVDNESAMTELIRAYLKDEGYTNFVVTNDPHQTLDLLRHEDPSVLLLDLMMPHLSGFEVLAAIRAERALRYTPVIVLSDSTSADVKLRALQLGATDFLSKPVDPSELVLRVRNNLAFRQYHTRLANFDAVTGLPTQMLFDRGIDEMVERRDLVGGLVAYFSISVPACRALRESVDQVTADGLARELARRLDRIASVENRATAISTEPDRAPRVARLDADRFGLVLEGRTDADSLEKLAKQLVVALSEPVVIDLHEVGPTVWIGIAVSPGDGQNAAALRKSADLASTHAHRQGINPYMFASPELNAKTLQRMTLGSQLRGAAQRGELRAHYQPKVDIKSNRIIGAEALVRWQHPALGMLAPGKFISLAEELGLIGIIGQWMMERACLDVASWARAGLGELKVAINVANPQFRSGDLCATLARIMRESGLRPRQVVIELTESMLMDDVEHSRGLMSELKALGVTLSIDDFGTGFSSLSYLKKFPLDELKIDQSFVVDLPGEPADVAIVRTIVDLGHRLDMSVIAEGVETERQLACLKLLGCDHYQGYHFSKPMPSDRFAALLSQENERHGWTVSLTSKEA
jgi:EAL domain-containing protein (putative c-di-GMP-specific phosphodiesterase class I)/PleD family two-component response regulator